MGPPYGKQHPEPLEKELLIRLYGKSPDVKLSDFCCASNVSEAAFKTWLKKCDAEGLAGPCRSRKTPAFLPEGVDETDESFLCEPMRTRIEPERQKRLCPDPERRWDAGRIRVCIREERATAEALSKEFPVVELYAICQASRSGCCKWEKRGGKPPRDRARVLRLVRDFRDAYPSHGCRWARACLKKSDGLEMSAEYVRGCFLHLGIRAGTKHRKKARGARPLPQPRPLVLARRQARRQPRERVPQRVGGRRAALRLRALREARLGSGG